MVKRLDTTLSILVTCAALGIAIALVHREFIAPARIDRQPSPSDPPTFVRDWRDLVEAGVQVGSRDATVRIIEFSDLQCPFCKSFHSSLQRARRELGSAVAFTFVHFPLSGYAHAYEAAAAAQCAAIQGVFEPFIDLVFAKQDSLGVKTLNSFAVDAGIRDTVAFAQCTADSSTQNVVAHGRTLGSALHVAGTPTVIVNGWRFSSTPPDSQFQRVVSDIAAGREPFPNARRGSLFR